VPQGLLEVSQRPVVDIKASAKVATEEFLSHTVIKFFFCTKCFFVIRHVKVIVERWSDALSDQLLYR